MERVSVKANKEAVHNFGKVWGKLRNGMRKALSGKVAMEGRLNFGWMFG